MRTHALRRLTAVCSLAGALLLGACGDFNVTNPNQPTLDDLINNPTRGKLSSAATGLFIGSRADIRGLIWRGGSMGREGVNLFGNNQPDFQEPYFGPLSGTGFGAAIWDNEFRQVRSTNVYLNAVPKVAQLAGSDGISAGEASASLGFAKTLKALAFLYVVMTHGDLGAPVDVDRAVADGPAPFVAEDSVYGYILGLLNDAKNDLTTAGGTAFPFPLPSGYAGFDSPATFLKFNRALAAKAYLYRATAKSSSCGPTQCYTDALAALSESFLNKAGDFKDGVYFNFSTGAGDQANDLSDALDGQFVFALPLVAQLSQKQAGGADDKRVLDKITAATLNPPQQIAGIPIKGDFKFTIYLRNGTDADPSAPIPIIRNEELILLEAEANIGLNNLPGAVTDLDLVRTQSGNLPALGTLPDKQTAIAELLYNRRYSLLWEQGATWVDARRYGLLSTIPVPDGFANGANPQPGFGPSVVPTRLLIPDTECSARGLVSGCSPLGT